MAMQGRSGIVTGGVLQSSIVVTEMYSTNPSGVAVSNAKLEMSYPYIAIVSTFEPLEGEFRLIMYSEKSYIQFDTSRGNGASENRKWKKAFY